MEIVLFESMGWSGGETSASILWPVYNEPQDFDGESITLLKTHLGKSWSFHKIL